MTKRFEEELVETCRQAWKVHKEWMEEHQPELKPSVKSFYRGYTTGARWAHERSQEEIKRLREALECAKDFAVFMAKNYQENYSTFCDCSNVDYRKEITEERKKEFSEFMFSFSSIQGFEQRKFIEELAKIERTGKRFKEIQEALHTEPPQEGGPNE